MADANPAQAAPKRKKEEGAPAPSSEPVKVEYIGEGADKIKFKVDPKATRIRVYADGRILVDY